MSSACPLENHAPLCGYTRTQSRAAITIDPLCHTPHGSIANHRYGALRICRGGSFFCWAMFRSTSGHLHKAGGLNTVTCEETSCHLHVYLPSNRPASAGERKCASDHSTKICPAKKCQTYGYYLFRILSSSWRLPSCDMLEAQYHQGKTWPRILLTSRDK